MMRGTVTKKLLMAFLLAILVGPLPAFAGETIEDFEDMADWSYWPTWAGWGSGGAATGSLVTADVKQGTYAQQVDATCPSGYAQSYKDYATARNWNGYDTMGFWMKGTNSGVRYDLRLDDTDHAIYLNHRLTDNYTGWLYREFHRGSENWSNVNRVSQFVDSASGTIYTDVASVYNLQATVIADWENSTGWQYWPTWANWGTGRSVTSSLDSTHVQRGTTSQKVVVTTAVGYANSYLSYAAPQDWSAMDTLSYWMYGDSSGLNYKIYFRRSAGDLIYTTTIDFTGWRLVEFERGSDDWSAITRVDQFVDGAATGTFWVDSIQVIPEPATLVLIGLGGIGLLLRRRR